MLGARCEVGDAIVGSLHVYFGDDDGEPGPEHHAVLELLAASSAGSTREPRLPVAADDA